MLPDSEVGKHSFRCLRDSRGAAVKAGVQLAALIDAVDNDNLQPRLGQGHTKRRSHKAAADYHYIRHDSLEMNPSVGKVQWA